MAHAACCGQRRITHENCSLPGHHALTLSPDSPAQLPLPCDSHVTPAGCSYSNLILTEADGRIVSCARQVSSRMSSRRSLQTGAAYAPPPPQPGAAPSAAEPQEAWQAAVLAAAERGKAGDVGSALAAAYQVCPHLWDKKWP